MRQRPFTTTTSRNSCMRSIQTRAQLLPAESRGQERATATSGRLTLVVTKLLVSTTSDSIEKPFYVRWVDIQSAHPLTRYCLRKLSSVVLRPSGSSQLGSKMPDRVELSREDGKATFCTGEPRISWATTRYYWP